MQSRGFGADSITRYKMVNKFHQERRPLIVVICGAPCTGAVLTLADTLVLAEKNMICAEWYVALRQILLGTATCFQIQHAKCPADRPVPRGM